MASNDYNTVLPRRTATATTDYSGVTPTPQPCPSCGHCPTCGRSNRLYDWDWYWRQPYIPWQPFPNPIYSQSNGSTAIKFDTMSAAAVPNVYTSVAV
jgi:hypothetical protein